MKSAMVFVATGVLTFATLTFPNTASETPRNAHVLISGQPVSNSNLHPHRGSDRHSNKQLLTSYDELLSEFLSLFSYKEFSKFFGSPREPGYRFRFALEHFH